MRSAYELEIDPSPFAESDSVRYLNLPLQNESDNEAMAHINSDITLSEMYRVMLQHFGSNIAAIVEAVAVSDGAVVIHCHAGKDLTGLVIALLLAFVWVEDALVAADYAASHHYLEAFQDELLESSELERGVGLEHRLGAEAATMFSTLDWLKTEYGGVEAYLLEVGVSENMLAKLRRRLVGVNARGSL